MLPTGCPRSVPADQSFPAQTFATPGIVFRTATRWDACKIWRLVGESGVLDANSRYCYLLLCRDFADTCLVACRDDELLGFVTAYRPPGRPDCVFVWQIGVTETARGQGLASRLLQALVALPACREVRYLEATVTPSNRASRRLFYSFAETLRVPCVLEQGFPAELFGFGDHEEEELFRIGPFADSPQENPAR